ncbi:MAG: hypothetical protein ACO1O1_13635 [Adhaeribacter sp.]
MKRILFIFAFFSWMTSFGQVAESPVDLNLVRHAIQKSVRYPEQAIRQGKAGACLFKISKKGDTIELETILASGIDFHLEKNKTFLEALKRYLPNQPATFEVVVPINFFIKGNEVKSPFNAQIIEPVSKCYVTMELIEVTGYTIVCRHI